MPMAQRIVNLWHTPSLCRRWWVISRPAGLPHTHQRCSAAATQAATETAAGTGSKVKYEAVIGIETHVQLQTKTKMFCSCENTYGSEPNSHVCPVCYGEPGTLPMLNQHAVQLGITAGLGLNCKISRQSNFDRKQYFYPDLPKGYQISQYETPLCLAGEIEIEVPGSEPKRIGITRAHLEEDAGKLVHAGSDRLTGSSHSLVDYNRAGLPLLEIVSEPDMRTGKEAAAYGAELRRIVRFLGVSDGNMAEGSMRCDVNVSVRPEGREKFGTKVEVKNLNSFANMQRAIEFEIARQVALIEEGQADDIVQETRLWDEGKLVTYSMRKKEGLADYRYFPEPDLPPLVVTEEQLEQIKSQMAELPAQKRQRYLDLGLPKADALILADDLGTANFFDAVLALNVAPKAAANWIIGDIAAYCNEQKLSMEQLPMNPGVLGEMLSLIDDGTISGKIAKEVLPDLLSGKANEGGVRKFVESKGLVQISDPAAIGALIDDVLAASPKQLEQYKSGKTKLRGFFQGQVMKVSGGRANPKLLDSILTQKLEQA